MPPIRGRSGAIRATQQPVAQPVSQPIQAAPTPPIEITGLQGILPVMISSLPPMASGNDGYSRQFYRSLRVPFRRYLPIRSQ